MTDTTVAADTGGTPSTPAANEVTINPNPVSVPAPIGSQAPQAPAGDVKGSPHHPKSAREAIQDAYNRALNPPAPKRPAAKEPAKEPPKPADAKSGHNKPPEKTDAEKPLNLKKSPDSQAEPEPQPRDRGRFAPRQETAADKASLSATGGDGAPASQPAPSPLPHDAPFREPPPRMADHAKKDWAAAPESVRGEVHRMHREFSQAYEQYKGAAEAFAPVAHFHKMAQDHGTTLQQALTNYTSMERKLNEDVVAGLDLIVNNIGLKTPDGQPIGLRDIAYHVLSQTPDQLKTLQQGNTVNAAQHQIGALHQQVAGLTNIIQQMQYGQQYGQTRSAIDVFADAPGHERFDELATAIDQELKSGYDLETAYRRADLLNPASHAAQTRAQSAQTRETQDPDRSISGAPGGSTNGASKPSKRGESRSVRDSVEHAARRVSNGF